MGLWETDLDWNPRRHRTLAMLPRIRLAERFRPWSPAAASVRMGPKARRLMWSGHLMFTRSASYSEPEALKGLWQTTSWQAVTRLEPCPCRLQPRTRPSPAKLPSRGRLRLLPHARIDTLAATWEVTERSLYETLIDHFHPRLWRLAKIRTRLPTWTDRHQQLCWTRSLQRHHRRFQRKAGILTFPCRLGYWLRLLVRATWLVPWESRRWSQCFHGPITFETEPFKHPRRRRRAVMAPASLSLMLQTQPCNQTNLLFRPLRRPRSSAPLQLSSPRLLFRQLPPLHPC